MTLLEGESDQYKKMGEWALAAGRLLQSKQTGYVHYTYGELPPFDAIPLVENALFVLSLFRSRLMEQAQEAKSLLNALLAFQNLIEKENYGNFPVYLHEYPICKDSVTGLQLLAPFYWILRHFGNVLGTPLKDKLEHAVLQSLTNSLAANEQKRFPYAYEVRLSAALAAFGMMWKMNEWEQRGMKQLEELSTSQLEGWKSTKNLSDMLIGLQMIYPSLKYSSWQPLWLRMEETWHMRTGSYIGPCLREWQEGEESQANLYDLFGGYFTGQFSRRATLLRPFHLHAAVIQASQDKFSFPSSDFVVSGQLRHQNWQTISDSSYVYTLLEKKGPLNPSIDNTFTPFRLIWGDLHRQHSFVCQGGNYDNVACFNRDSCIELIFELKGDLSSDQNKKREVEFFLDFHSGVQFSLSNLSSSTFKLGQELKIALGSYQLNLICDLIEGEGDFLGHIMRGNRPSQISNKAENRFKAYDWTIFLRTIRRQNDCRLRARIALIEASERI